MGGDPFHFSMLPARNTSSRMGISHIQPQQLQSKKMFGMHE